MNLKSHYKMIISIIIVIILLSSLIVYYNDARSNPRTYYSPTDYQYNLKYFDDGNAFPINANRTFSHEITSFGIYNNMEVNLTSNIISPGACIHTLSGGQFFACLGVNVTGHIPGITSINVSAGKLYNTFNIHAEKESAIYGSIQNYSTGNTVHVNTTLYIENMNNSIINPINVRDGYYYYFVQPYTEYKLYSLNSTNNTLKLIDTISNKNITSGNSYRNAIPSDEL